MVQTTVCSPPTAKAISPRPGLDLPPLTIERFGRTNELGSEPFFCSGSSGLRKFRHAGRGPTQLAKREGKFRANKRDVFKMLGNKGSFALSLIPYVVRGKFVWFDGVSFAYRLELSAGKLLVQCHNARVAD
jgi:hypothetical protein